MIKRCEICGRQFSAKRSTAKYCSNGCKQKAYRHHQGYPFAGELKEPDVRLTLTEEDVRSVVQQAHITASDLSRAAMSTTAPLCLSLGRCAKALEQALRREGL